MWEAFQLPTFSGEGDIEEWICKFESFFETTGLQEEGHRILYAGNYLTGAAHAKWRGVLQQAKEGKIREVSTWQDFKSQMLRCFKPNHNTSASRNDHQQQIGGVAEEPEVIKQKELSVGEYTDHFLDSRKLHRYISGLNPGIAAYVNVRKPKRLQEAVTLALQAEKQASEAAATRLSLAIAKNNNEKKEDQTAKKRDVKLCFVVYYGDDDYGKWLRGRVNGQTVSFVASNSSDNFVSESAVQRLRSGNLVVPKLEFEIDGGYVDQMDFAVMKFSRHDFVLGNPFFGNNFRMSATELRIESQGCVYNFTLHSDPPCSIY